MDWPFNYLKAGKKAGSEFPELEEGGGEKVLRCLAEIPKENKRSEIGAWKRNFS